MSTQLSPTMRGFPPPEDVFAGDVAAHRKVLQPLLTIDASEVDPAWSGKLHFVTPLEPYDGLLGDGADAFYKDSVALNWIAFRVRDSKYEFAGDFNYFGINRARSDFLTTMYAEKEANYAEAKKYFADTGQLGGAINGPLDWIDEIGGAAQDGNWCAFGLPVEVDKDRFAHPLTPDKRRFRYVGSLSGYNYRSECADSILLFFDPKTSTAALTFDWT